MDGTTDFDRPDPYFGQGPNCIPELDRLADQLAKQSRW